MNSREFLESVGDIDNEMIKAAQEMEAKPRRRRGVLTAALLAAALGAAVTVAVLMPKAPAGDKEASASTPVPAVTGKPTELPADRQEDPAAKETDEVCFTDTNVEGLGTDRDGRYLIYNNRYYDLISVVEGGDPLVGERLGEITEVVDPDWFFDMLNDFAVDEGSLPAHTAMPYREHAGGMLGPIYSLRGYDPELVVGQLEGDGALRVYYNIAATEHRRGAELFETFFNGFNGLEFRSKLILHRNPASYYEEVWEPIGAEYGERVSAFIAALDEAEWRNEEEIFNNGISTADRVGYLRLTKPDGMHVNLVVWENGCVWIYEAHKLENGRVLCLDNEAAEGIASLIRGKSEFLDPDKAPDTTLEDCVNDPELGAAVPKHAPEGFIASAISLNTEEGVRHASLIFRPEGENFPDLHIDVVPKEHAELFDGSFGEATAFYEIESFDKELIRAYPDEDFEYRAAFVYAGGCAVRITACAPLNGEWDLAELIMSVLDSIKG